VAPPLPIGSRWQGGEQGRSQAWVCGGLSPPKQKYSPPNEMKHISPFGLGINFLVFSIIFHQSKEPAAERNCFRFEKCWLKLQPNLNTQTKNPGNVPEGDGRSLEICAGLNI